ncbi:MAG: flavin reductase family protein [Clostridiales bacterium]|nr:flavin reductase family protein [Clostridiales bacterium]
MENQFLSLKPGTLLAPVPAVMVSCQRPGEKPNAITLAWVGTVCSEPPMVSISIRKERYSHAIVKETGEFIINLCGEDNLKATDYCGVKSGRDEDKFAACHMTALPVEGFTAPAIAECPIYLACRVQSVQELGSHDLFLGLIEKMGVRKDLMDETGRIDYNRAHLVAYNHGAYYGLGEALGFFGYSVAAPDVLERRMKQLK